MPRVAGMIQTGLAEGLHQAGRIWLGHNNCLEQHPSALHMRSAAAVLLETTAGCALDSARQRPASDSQTSWGVPASTMSLVEITKGNETNSGCRCFAEYDCFFAQGTGY